MTETNHGRLPDGTIWATFCSNAECNILGCPGDCLDSEDPDEGDDGTETPEHGDDS